MMNMLQLIEPWVFLTFVVLFLSAALYSISRNRFYAAIVSGLAGFLSGGFLYIDHLSEISVSASALDVKVREASDALTGLQRISSLIGADLIRLNASSGAIGGFPASYLDQTKKEILDELRRIQVDDGTLARVAHADKENVIITYAVAIRNRGAMCDISPADIGNWQGAFLRSDQLPDLKTIKDTVERFNVHDAAIDKMLSHLTYYLLHGEQQNDGFWSDRDKWVVTLEDPQGKPLCQTH